MEKNKTNIWKILLVVVAIGAIIAIFITSGPSSKMPTRYEFTDTVSTDITLVLPDSLTSVCYFVNSDYNDIDTMVVEKGVAKVILRTPNYSFISLFDKDQVFAVVIADGYNINFDLTKNELKASQLNERFYKSRVYEEDKFLNPLHKLYEEYMNTDEDSLAQRSAIEDKIDEIDTEYAMYTETFAKGNVDNILPAYAISQAFYSYNYETLSKLLDSAAVYTGHPILDYAKSHLGGLYKRRDGIMFTDITMKDTEGNEVSLSQWAGQGTYVFVDFWASWCSPCRGELPNILEVYDKYHNKEGFDVVGVSVDSNRDSWVKCIDMFGLPWHHMSELSGRGGLTKDVYGVGAIPCSILLNPEGYIVASDLRGEQLMETLKKIYGY